MGPGHPDLAVSLLVIVGTLAVTAIASLMVSRNMSQEQIEARTMSMPRSDDDRS